MFGRSKQQEQARQIEATESTAPQDPTAPKGRPTPSRKDAESARKQSRHVPADPKAAKRARKEREKLERAEARAGMMSGDARYLPKRDQGPAKAFSRDFVDRRRRLSEFFVFVALGILVATLVPSVQQVASLIWFAVTIAVAIEITWMLVTLSRELKERWPDKADRKGCMFYAAIRALQIRKLRIPPPQVRTGGRPIK